MGLFCFCVISFSLVYPLEGTMEIHLRAGANLKLIDSTSRMIEEALEVLTSPNANSR